MSILSVDTIQPIGSGSTVTLNAAKIVVGTGITFESNGQAIYAGIITATSFSGSGANLTSLPAQATIANNADNRIITGGSGVNLNGESGLTFDGTTLTVSGASNSTQAIFAGTGGSGSRGLEIKTESGGAVDEVVVIKTRASGTTGAIKFQTNGANSLELAGNGGDVTVKQGNLKFGIGAKGIDFSSTGDASGMTSELFNDYEEGSFTPTSNASISDLGGRYTKIGRQVTVHIRCTIGSNSSSNQMNIAGLPYAAAMDSSLSNGSVPSGFGYIGGSVINGGIQLHMNYNAAQTHFYNFGTAMTQASFSGRHIRFGIVYYAA